MNERRLHSVGRAPGRTQVQRNLPPRRNRSADLSGYPIRRADGEAVIAGGLQSDLQRCGTVVLVDMG